MSPILQALLLLISSLLPNAKSYTIIVSDSNNQSDLVDGPQNGLPLSKNRARTDAREQEAVYDIMRATGNYWATDIPDVCRGRWHGIECMPDKDNVWHVVSLSFGALSDDTAFPVCDPTKSYLSESIAKLPRLKSLFFYRCLTYNPQPIPSFLGQLGPSLQTLVLRENGHVGPIPNELGNLTHLKTLDLHHNDLNGSIPVSLKALTGLRTLDLSNNKLTGPIPGGSFPDLSILDVSQNLLDSSIPPIIGSWQSLIKLDASRNRLTGSIPESIGGLKELILLDLSYNRLSNPLPPSIRNLTSLQAFMLKGNPMSSVTLSSVEFDCMKSLIILVLSNVGLNGPIPESLGRLTNLRVVHLDGNRFNGSIPTNFKELRNLAELRLNDNQLSGPIPFGNDLVWRMKRKLKLQNNIGLCYGGDTGLDDDMNMGIGLCSNSVRPISGSAKTVQHVSAAGDLTGARSKFSSSDDSKVSIVVRGLLPNTLITTFLVLMLLRA